MWMWCFARNKKKEEKKKKEEEAKSNSGTEEALSFWWDFFYIYICCVSPILGTILYSISQWHIVIIINYNNTNNNYECHGIIINVQTCPPHNRCSGGDAGGKFHFLNVYLHVLTIQFVHGLRSLMLVLVLVLCCLY